MTELPPTTAPVAARAIRLAIVEDNPGYRGKLRELLDRTPGFRCLGEFANGESALKELPGLAPDVVFMDIGLGDGISGIECVRQLRALLPDTRIMMLTVLTEPKHVFAALAVGANGYCSKAAPLAELLQRIQQLREFGAALSPDIAPLFIEFFQRAPPATGSPADLTVSEWQVLELLASGLLYKDIARQLDCSYHAVHFHLRHIYEKLHVHSRTQAAAWYFAQRPPNRG